MGEGLLTQLGAWLCGFMFLGFLGLSGCPPPSTTGPETGGSKAGVAARGPSREQESARAAREATPRSSLEALRRGESPVTPASSPLKEIYFDFDRYDVRTDARDTLKANGGWLKNNPAVRVEIEGHADDRGTNEYNLALGAKRAQAAKDYLVTLGISAQRLTTISYGEEVPACKEHNEECWQKNRRGRFVVTPARPGL